MADSATWLKQFLAPLVLLWKGVKQNRDDRVDFRDGFVASQVPDANGVNVLTFDTEVGAATETPDPSKVPIRSASGALYATSFVADPAGFFAYSSAKPVTVVEKLSVLEVIDPVTGWSIVGGGTPKANAVGLTWTTEITPPHGATITSISVRLAGDTGHVALPANMPTFSIAQIDGDGNVLALGGPYVDASPDIASYEVFHAIDSGTVNLPIDRTQYRYFVTLSTESGANSLPNTVISQPARWTADIVAL